MGSITSADAVLMISVATVFPVPVQLQGFAVDDVYDIGSIQSAETRMGVDGIFSAGFVFAPITQDISLQANSESNDLFDQWWTLNQSNKTSYPASGLLLLPSIGRKWNQSTGYLTGYAPAPPGKRVLEPRRFQITWGRILPAPA